MQWYMKVVDQKFVSVELFLFNVYEYSLFGQLKNFRLVVCYFQWVYQYFGGSVRVEVVLELVWQINLECEDFCLFGFQFSVKQICVYLEEILKFEFKDIMVLDWLMGIYFDLYDYFRVLEMVWCMDNLVMWVQMVLVLVDDYFGFFVQLKLVVIFFKWWFVVVKNDKGEVESMFYFLMQLECEKKIS